MVNVRIILANVMRKKKNVSYLYGIIIKKLNYANSFNLLSLNL
jgi:hypothetical protein